MKKPEKRGEVLPEILITITILIISLGIIGSWIYAKYFKTPEIIDRETCYQSVLLRSNFFIKEVPGKLPTLACKTLDVEIKDSREEVIKKSIANEMAACWQMLGRGKLDFMGPEYLDAPNRCIMCSVISFDENVRKKVKEVKGLEQYIAQNNVPSTITPAKEITYLEYITNSENAAYKIETAEQPIISTNKNYAVILVTLKGITWENDLATVVAGASGALSGGLIGLVFGGLPGGLIGAGYGLYAGVGVGTASFLTEIKSQVKGCDESFGGCTTLLLVPYEADTLNEVCDNLESLP